jgi:probable rRNA maturation factor
VLRNRQKIIRFETAWIKQVVQRAIPECLAVALPKSPLPGLAAIEATLISDKDIAHIHNIFFQDPDPTDVITYDHGEILIGAGTVSSQAAGFSHTPTQEAALCIIHGILHLGGWNDGTPAQARKMAAMQSRIFQTASAGFQTGKRGT